MLLPAGAYPTLFGLLTLRPAREGVRLAPRLHALGKVPGERGVGRNDRAAPLAQPLAPRRLEAAEGLVRTLARLAPEHASARLQHERDAGGHVPNPGDEEGGVRQRPAGG